MSIISNLHSFPNLFLPKDWVPLTCLLFFHCSALSHTLCSLVGECPSLWFFLYPDHSLLYSLDGKWPSLTFILSLTRLVPPSIFFSMWVTLTCLFLLPLWFVIPSMLFRMWVYLSLTCFPCPDLSLSMCYLGSENSLFALYFLLSWLVPSSVPSSLSVSLTLLTSFSCLDLSLYLHSLGCVFPLCLSSSF